MKNETLGWIAFGTGIAMVSSMVDQIKLNVTGQTGSSWYATVATINCTLWMIFFLRQKKQSKQLIYLQVYACIMHGLNAITSLLF